MSKWEKVARLARAGAAAGADVAKGVYYLVLLWLNLPD